MAWVVYKSPLWHKDTVQDHIKPLPNGIQRKILEASFINDAIRTQVYHYPRKKPIIPVYSAEQDKCAQAYFRSPLVKEIMTWKKLSTEVSETFQHLILVDLTANLFLYSELKVHAHHISIAEKSSLIAMKKYFSYSNS